MKFNDGYWMFRPGVEVLYPRQVHALDVAESSITAIALTHPYRGRGSVLNEPTITMELDSPMDDVIRVTVTHHSGGRTKSPSFEIARDPDARPTTSTTETAVKLRSGILSATLHTGADWKVDFAVGDRILTSSDAKSQGFASVDGAPFTLERLSLAVGESISGLGERFTPVVKNGQVVDSWNEDGGTSSEQAYKSIPFYLSNRGYGVLVDSPDRVSFEVGSEVVSRVQFSVPGQSLSYYVITGDSPAAILARYAQLTGRPALPPLWSFGLWLSTSFTTDYDEASVTALIDGMAERDLPLSVFHFDCFWMKSLQWCDYEWDPEVFPEPEAMLSRLHDRGLHTCVWINPYIGQRSPLFDEAKDLGYLLRRTDGDVWQSDMWVAGMGIIDLTNPDAREWFKDKLRAIVRTGVDALKADFGERIPVDGVMWADGSDPARMHNYYSFLYNRAMFEVLEEERGRGEAVLFSRSATVGSQRFPAHWGGDSEPTFVSMAETLRGGLSLSSSGFAFWSHDIGGFERTPDPDVFKRWLPFGLLSTHSRLHGSESYRVPWLVDDEAVDILRTFTKLKMRLMPYIWQNAVAAHETGVPVMRSMSFEFPDDPAVVGLEQQYMLGPSLLVAPIFNAEGEARYYVPSGTWTHFVTGKKITGPAWVRETHAVDSLPILVRPGVVIPVGAVDDRPDYDHAVDVELQYFEPDGRDQVVELFDARGVTAAEFRIDASAGNAVTLVSGSADGWTSLER
jgi:alpha-D-xyloside xylohydrolase